MKKLARWLRGHGMNSAYVVYLGNVPLWYYGIDTKNFPEPLTQHVLDTLDSFAVASVTPLYGVYVPPARLAQSIF